MSAMCPDDVGSCALCVETASEDPNVILGHTSRDNDSALHGSQTGTVRASSRDHEYKVVVSNLNYRTTWKSLKDHMKSAGEVQMAHVLFMGGRPSGRGVVVYKHIEGALRAVETLDRSLLDGRSIIVRPSRSRIFHLPNGACDFDAMNDQDVIRTASNTRHFVTSHVDADDVERSNTEMMVTRENESEGDHHTANPCQEEHALGANLAHENSSSSLHTGRYGIEATNPPSSTETSSSMSDRVERAHSMEQNTCTLCEHSSDQSAHTQH